MSKVSFAKSIPLFTQIEPEQDIEFGREDYEIRLKELQKRIQKLGLSHAIIYGDREHFSNIEYFSGYDCRFEESLFVMDADGNTSILVGNEGVSQTYPIPYKINVVLYQNFSLPGQPRGLLVNLHELLGQLGISKTSKVGLAGWKYFDDGTIDGDPNYTFDCPAYILEETRKAAGDVVSFTKELIGFPDGIRMQIRTAKEIAWIENAGNHVSNVMIRMMKDLKPGITETDLGVAGMAGMKALNVHPMINFGPEHVRIGVRSPNNRALELGEVCTVCYSCRGNLTSRVGIACYDEQSAAAELQPHMDFYKDHWYAITRWLETAKIGAGCAQLYDSVMDVIGDPYYGVALNPTHYTGTDEWTNSPMYKNSPYKIEDGAHIQVDIIASHNNPVMTSICEDCVVIAGEELRANLKKEYPETYARIMERQKATREVLGINISDDLLPMSNMNFAYNPFMLNLDRVFTLK